LDEKILIVYQRCCDNIGKNFEWWLYLKYIS
jgi:hypothetical protein